MNAIVQPRQVFVQDAVLFNADIFVLAFMRERLPHVNNFGECSTMGIVRDGRLIGGIVLNNYQPGVMDIEISAAFTTSAWWRPRTVRRIFHYPFGFLGCRRITYHCSMQNVASMRLAGKLGFAFEGRKRKGYDGTEDLALFGMLREDCRFLKEA